MDSDRTPDIEDNALGTSLRKAPDFFRDYGTYLLIGLIVLAAGWWYYNARTRAAAVNRQESAQALTNLSRTLASAGQMAQFAAFLPASEMDKQQAQLAAEFDSNAAVVDETGDSGAKGHALRLRGDFGWIFATLPPSPPAPPSTQPSTQPVPTTRPSSAWLADARAAYEAVVADHAQQTADALGSLFGLAAIAEQSTEFGKARDYYDQILARDDLGDATRTVARRRRALLDVLGTEPRLVASKTPAAATQPDIGDLLKLLPDPTTQPADQPATQAAGTTGSSGADVEQPEADASTPDPTTRTTLEPSTQP